MFLSFPGRYRMRSAVLAIMLFAAIFYAVIYFTNAPIHQHGGVRGLGFFPMFMWLFVGGFFQKLFAFFLPYLLTMWLFTLIETVLKLVMEYGTGEYYAVLTIATLIIFTGYLVVLIKAGGHLLRRLFELGRPTEWAVYSLGALFSFFLLMLFRSAAIRPELFVLLLLFIFWSFGVLCFAIIKTHEKTKKSDDADFAQSVISSGRGHYQKMNEMYDTLDILRRNYKNHLKTIDKLVKSGDIAEFESYLFNVLAELPDTGLRNYCDNSVINALLGSYAERCAKLNIEYDVRLSMPDTLSITNYDMCIILGNLLENAVEACQKMTGLSDHLQVIRQGKIEAAVKTQGSLLAVKVVNSFSGKVTAENGHPLSTKKNGGYGLRNIRAVADRYDGNMLTEWDTTTFTAYVMLRM